MVPPGPEPRQDANDIFSITDQVLAGRLQFIEEIGFGNWGSVWLCRPKPDFSQGSPSALGDNRIAVKLVHRSQTSTTAARVRSLWNEMKVVRALKHEPHPSVISFYSFIITPSYALITMAYHPKLIPVEVPEPHSKVWVRSLLSGVEFLHRRGVVHNDIKPANILLSQHDVPVLVDFGFSERYDAAAKNAFYSNLSYGTPEYLSPERARGLPHDTRKSDVWSLGVTLFEVIVGRTPFEHFEGEQLSTKEDLETYWNRTLRGDWVGAWKMSKGLESLLHRMILPDASVRCTASEAMGDAYWSQSEIPVFKHRKTASTPHAPKLSLHVDQHGSEPFDFPPGFPRAHKETIAGKDKRNKDSPQKMAPKTKEDSASSQPMLLLNAKPRRETVILQPGHGRRRSQPIEAFETCGKAQARKSGIPSLLATLSPIKHSPPTVSRVHFLTTLAKENISSLAHVRGDRSVRAPSRPRGPSSPSSGAAKTRARDQGNTTVLSLYKETQKSSRFFMDLTSTAINQTADVSSSTKGSVRDRMMDWQRERERLKEMDLFEERLKEADQGRQREQEYEDERRRQSNEESDNWQEVPKQGLGREFGRWEAQEDRHLPSVEKPQERPAANAAKLTPSSSCSSAPVTPPLNPASEELSHYSWAPQDLYNPPTNDSSVNIFKQSLKLSLEMLDRGVKLCKSSTHALGCSTPALVQMYEGNDSIVALKSSTSSNSPPSMEADAALADSVDRRTIWIRNVEKVVEDARNNFAASTISGICPPALPVAPVSRPKSAVTSRACRSGKTPRKVLAASEIFANEHDSSTAAVLPSLAGQLSFFGNENTIDQMHLTAPSEEPSCVLLGPDAPETPVRQRRATVSAMCPEAVRKRVISLEIDTSASPYKEKAKSQNDLNKIRAITPVAQLEFQLEREKAMTEVSSPPPLLSTVVDKNLFIATGSTPSSPRHTESPIQSVKSLDGLTASPCHVEPYPQRTVPIVCTLDTPTRRHIEGVYDRFLMSTAGVQRNGLGYQSNISAMSGREPVMHLAPKQLTQTTGRKRERTFLSKRHQMPPPVSSEDVQYAVDEFGALNPCMSTMAPHEQGKTTATIVRKALRAIISGKAASNRASKAF